MYKSSGDKELLNDINNRLEFVELSSTAKTPGIGFEFSAAQLFCRNYINPWSPYTRVINNRAWIGFSSTLIFQGNKSGSISYLLYKSGKGVFILMYGSALQPDKDTRQFFDPIINSFNIE